MISDINDYSKYVLKKHSEDVSGPSNKIYVNKIENRVTFKIRNGYYLGFLTPETMKLLESTESKITKDKNGENVPHLEIVELVLIHCNLVNNFVKILLKIQEYYMHLHQINLLVVYYIYHPQPPPPKKISF